MQTVALPVFQFGIFGENSLGFHAGDDFDFGGRVHTNENLFLASGNSRTLTFTDRITVVGQVVRQQLSNTYPITSSGHTGPVSIPKVIGSSYRNLGAGEGSVTAGPTSALWDGWKDLSKSTYNQNIRNTLTGAKRLDLPLVSDGAQPIDLIQRPESDDEDTTQEAVFKQRYFAMASLRILLSDRDTDLTSLPTITAGAPQLLDGTIGGRPVARSIGPNVTTGGTLPSYGGTGSSGTGTITINGGVPNWLRMAATATAPNFVFGGVTVSGCTGMTATSLTGCTTTGTAPTNTNAASALDLSAVGGGSITLRRSGTAQSPTGSGNNRTVPVVSTAGLALGTRVIWAGDTPVTCSGYDVPNNRLNGCYWSSTPSGHVRTSALSQFNQSLIGGFIKIEKQDIAGVWTDVTAEILGLGFAAPNQENAICANDPTPNAVIRIQRLRDNGLNPATSPCGYDGSTLATDYWPQVLFDAREATYREVALTADMTMGGVMNYIAIDIGNLKRWLAGAIGTTGTAALNNNGYIVYFSDRRGNHNWDAVNDPETGEYGNEDSINTSSGSAAQAPNNVIDGGEDRNAEDRDPDDPTTLEKYGERVENTVPGVLPTGAAAPYDATATPLRVIDSRGEARVNKQVLFRRALKLINGCIGVSGTTQGCNAANGVNNLPSAGLTITAENPVYVQGNYNATSASVTGTSVPAAVIGDAITILSNNWKDVNSLNSPNDMNGRDASGSAGYRFAMISGSSIPFPRPGWSGLAGNWGSDGGVHNFMRMLENWGGSTVFYRGSMVSLYTARQALGIFKDIDNVYQFPVRDFSFDTNFLQPQLLPPGTPMFRDINTLTFRQILRPTQ